MTIRAVRAPGASSRGTEALGWPVTGLALLGAVALGLPILVLVGRAVFDGALFATTTVRVVVDALALSLLTTSISLVLTKSLCASWERACVTLTFSFVTT